LFFSGAVFVFALYLFTGLLGAPLNSLASMLPISNNSRTTTSQITISQSTDNLCGIPKHSENRRLSLPHGLKGYFDYDEALACAKEKNKPILLIFKGHACAKCREMEALVWIDNEILNLMNEKFILVGLYTDDNTRLPENEWITSSFDGRIKRTIGQKNADFQIVRYQTNTFPYHAILNTNGETIGSTIGFTASIDEFKNWLRAGLDRF
jgi:thiol:disulfide interchange protein DsbD